MTKYGRPPLGHSGVEDLGDVGVIHERERLALGLEAGDDLLRVHPGLDDLEGDAARDRLGLLGDVDDAHPAFADLLAELVAPDDGPRSRSGGARAIGDVRRGLREGVRALEHGADHELA
jgi:hypothetical protein